MAALNSSSADSHTSIAKALVIAPAAASQELGKAIGRAGYTPVPAEDPYAAAIELLRRPLAYRALVISLAAVYPTELELIGLVKRRFGHVEVILAHATGRPAAQEQAIGLGADWILDGDQLVRARAAKDAPDAAQASAAPARDQRRAGSILSVDELNALLGG